MSGINLRFVRPLDTSHPVDMIFNAPAVPAEESNITPAGTIAAPTMVASLNYDNAVHRGPSGITATAWSDGVAGSPAAVIAVRDGRHAKVLAAHPWGAASPVRADARQSMQHAAPVPTSKPTAWGIGLQSNADLRASHQVMIRSGSRRSSAFSDGVWRHTQSHALWQVMSRRARAALGVGWDDATQRCASIAAMAAAGIHARINRLSPWGQGRHAFPGQITAVIPPVIAPCYVPPLGGAANLLFRASISHSTNILFSCNHNQPAAVIVPVRRTYIVLNDVNLRRVDGNIQIPTYSLSIKIDMDSWTWAFSASMLADQLSNLAPGGPGEPVELEATINGQSYRLFAEEISRDRQFAKTMINVSGRGISAMLADPYAPIMTFANAEARTAHQLAGDALTEGGVSIGWAVDWRITDWLVPAGAWNFQGSRMAAITAIAAAAGAFVQPDPVDQILRIRPRYPLAPWEWSALTPDFSLPPDIATKEGVSWTERPQYNRVHVSGTTAGGILGDVKRAGTAGDIPAQMVTDMLITAAAAARQRGIQVLADTGRIANYTLSLPVLSETGIIEPGSMIDYVDDGNTSRGIVKSVDVTVGMPSVRQTILLETHG